MKALLQFSDTVDHALERIARVAGWIFPLLAFVICWDVLTRKAGFQLPGFGSTPIQELEWHLHGMLFLFWLGYAYVRNVHVRIDVFTAHLPPRKLAWLEVIGIVLFAIPYCLVATWFAFWFAETSFMQNERSEAPNGLGYRWIIKSCLFLGLALMCLAVASVFSRRLFLLFGGRGPVRAVPLDVARDGEIQT
jgi:TRAP-type mannitol/chloroaromatic compound transport system permease small subunit